MIKHPFNKSQKILPNVWAKIMLIDSGKRVFNIDWSENGLDEATKEEIEKCAEALRKHYSRVCKFLGVSE